MSSVQLSEVLWASLKQDHVWEHREVVFIAHSLGGILVEEMLLRHPPEANRVKFIVSYGTPHEGSFVARLAWIYDNDPLLSDLKGRERQCFPDAAGTKLEGKQFCQWYSPVMCF